MVFELILMQPAISPETSSPFWLLACVSGGSWACFGGAIARGFAWDVPKKVSLGFWGVHVGSPWAGRWAEGSRTGFWGLSQTDTIPYMLPIYTLHFWAPAAPGPLWATWLAWLPAWLPGWPGWPGGLAGLGGPGAPGASWGFLGLLGLLRLLGLWGLHFSVGPVYAQWTFGAPGGTYVRRDE